jgi:hypothetical protein
LKIKLKNWENLWDVGRSMASKTRKEEKVGSFVSNMDSAIEDLDNGIRLENND